MSEVTIIKTRRADANHAVTTIKGGSGQCRVPCAECPWRVENVGDFPVEAFRISASTAYDMADHTFGCHTAGIENPKTCAGALLSTGAEHNLNVRMRLINGRFTWDDVSAGDAELFADYRSMAVANGVDPDDPVLAGCR